jgi:hypothetical protein
MNDYHLSFTAESSHVQISAGKNRFHTSRRDLEISFVTKLDRSHPIGGVSAGGSNLSQIEGGVVISPASDGDELGFLEYGKAYPATEDQRAYPATYYIRVFIPDRQFDTLLGQVRAGFLPRLISIGVVGFTLPTEFEYAWDVVASPKLQLTAFDVNFSSKPDEEKKPETPAVNYTDELKFIRIVLITAVVLLLFIAFKRVR